MKITITPQYSSSLNLFGDNIIGYRADFTELSGSPFVGTGLTKEAAVATLFIRNKDKLHLLDMNYLEIDGVPYKDYYSYER